MPIANLKVKMLVVVGKKEENKCIRITIRNAYAYATVMHTANGNASVNKVITESSL